MDVRRVPGWGGCPASEEGRKHFPLRQRRAGELVRVPRGLRLARAGYSEWAQLLQGGGGGATRGGRWPRLPDALLPAVPYSLGVLASVCGGLVMLLPETKGIALPETVDDVEKLGRYCINFSASYIKSAFQTPGEKNAWRKLNTHGEGSNMNSQLTS